MVEEITMFHDARIDRVIAQGKSVIIETDEFSPSENEIVSAQRITITNFKSIILDKDTLVDSIGHLTDCEIYDLRLAEDRIALTVLSYSSYSVRAISHMYEFIGGAIHTEKRDGTEA